VTAPFVGLPTEVGGCAFSVELDSEPCGKPPTLHIQVRAEGWGTVALDTCDEHAGLARASGSWVTEHAYGPDCPPSTACWLGTSDTEQQAAGDVR
jgi:hypothetical protein